MLIYKLTSADVYITYKFSLKYQTYENYMNLLQFFTPETVRVLYITAKNWFLVTIAFFRLNTLSILSNSVKIVAGLPKHLIRKFLRILCVVVPRFRNRTKIQNLIFTIFLEKLTKANRICKNGCYGAVLSNVCG